MHSVDAELGDFLRKLSEEERLSHIVVVIYGDHRARLPREELEQIGVFDRNEDGKIAFRIGLLGVLKGPESDTTGLLSILFICPLPSAMSGDRLLRKIVYEQGPAKRE